MIKTREFADKNYRSIYFNGKTMRVAINPDKPIEDLNYPEFYDIKLTNKCRGGCPYCYQDSKNNGNDYEAVGKLSDFFESMTENQKPFQVAYGGGEPTEHYQFHDIMRVTRGLGISPNYTTNGMFIDTPGCENVIATTKRYCEGVAISCHEHLREIWERCARRLIDEGIFLNFHNIIGGKDSIDAFLEIYKEWHGKVKYFVVLPLVKHGRASEAPNDFEHFFGQIEKIDNISDIAFGANFFPYLKGRKKIPVSLYEPEIMSKYLDLKDMALYPSSFNTSTPIKFVG